MKRSKEEKMRKRKGQADKKINGITNSLCVLSFHKLQ